MTKRIAINGFGRIGRMAVRAGLNNPNISFVAVNDLTDAKTNAHLLKYDSVHGILLEEVKVEGKKIKVGKHEMEVFTEKDPSKLPWAKLKVDVVLECTGVFTKREQAQVHLRAGAKKVIISAPANDADATVVLGVNEQVLAEKGEVISNASCTTNSLSPVAYVMEKTFGIERGMMNTIHSYTNDQRILDLPHKDLRRARAAALSIIPTTTGATKAAAKTVPALKDKMQGVSLRVPTPCGSITDFVFIAKKTPKDEAEVNAAFKKAADTYLKGIMEYSEEPLVSSDIIDNPHSAIIDALSTQVNGNLIRVMAWYDNEWGYSCRLVELAEKLKI
ncbi:type I glyceraldehyde-3-phosphate dehydrogenase [Candidatus Parcubacteria bacterium]|jgi:glyceraldehyde 3-phosphate dehydrogenase|nr:MAG: type I glyceraldehyde-3-phosphate dehydrogenase [Candidatus Parcubacteria bacterium]